MYSIDINCFYNRIFCIVYTVVQTVGTHRFYIAIYHYTNIHIYIYISIKDYETRFNFPMPPLFPEREKGQTTEEGETRLKSKDISIRI